MSQCGNNNELALQHGRFCTTWSLAAKGLLPDTHSKRGKNHAYVVRLVLVLLLIGWKNWRDCFKPITKRSNRNHVITFHSHLKTALCTVLYLHWMVISHAFNFQEVQCSAECKEIFPEKHVITRMRISRRKKCPLLVNWSERKVVSRSPRAFFLGHLRQQWPPPTTVSFTCQPSNPGNKQNDPPSFWAISFIFLA